MVESGVKHHKPYLT